MSNNYSEDENTAKITPAQTSKVEYRRRSYAPFVRNHQWFSKNEHP
jgi:hypothetical protein